MPAECVNNEIRMKHFDVAIVGAGISGIGAACHLQKQCPNKTYVILESRDALGGTWDLYRYPGIRSDSDMHTLGYEFKPWVADKSIADGPAILDYVRKTAEENDILKHILFKHRVQHAAWSTDNARWTLKLGPSDDGTGPSRITCNVLLMCSGYFSYDQPYRPYFDGEDTFTGPIFHPQLWPRDLDYTGKRVVVIGSGATAITLLPAMAEKAEHITMLQRSPSYVVAYPDRDLIANTLRNWLPENFAYWITRFKNIRLQHHVYHLARRSPQTVKRLLLSGVRKQLGPDYDVDTHFTPHYPPWDQRLCIAPNGDLFQAIRSGKASVVTDQIERITPNGIRLRSGTTLEADIIVVATGLNVRLLGGVDFDLDGDPVRFPQTYTYKGRMYSDVPNLVHTFGYLNASWTLRADLTADFACRLLNRMDQLGVRQCTPRLRDQDHDMSQRPGIEGFSAGYVRRAMPLFPKQGDHPPWINLQNYIADRKLIRIDPQEDGALVFDNPPAGS